MFVKVEAIISDDVAKFARQAARVRCRAQRARQKKLEGDQLSPTHPQMDSGSTVVAEVRLITRLSNSSDVREEAERRRQQCPRLLELIYSSQQSNESNSDYCTNIIDQ